MINWPAFYYGFKLLGIAALVVLISLMAAADEKSRQHIVSNLMLVFLIVYVVNIVAAAVQKQMPEPVKELMESEEADDETEAA
jgi:hypothetical protein